VHVFGLLLQADLKKRCGTEQAGSKTFADTRKSKQAAVREEIFCERRCWYRRDRYETREMKSAADAWNEWLAHCSLHKLSQTPDLPA
jgi:hypothetical protein